MLAHVRSLFVRSQATRRMERAALPFGGGRMLAGDSGAGPEWQAPAYGEYYARSADVYAAVHLGADAVARPPLVVQQRDAQAGMRPVSHDHPVQRLLDRVNPWWTSGDLLTATETYLCLWGAAFWYLVRGERGEIKEIWALRPDRVRVVREGARYVAGFVYTESGRDFPLLPEEVTWFRYFNPLDEFAGLSPLAPARLTADMGLDALRFNREFFRNGAQPQDLIFRARGPVTDDQVNDFYKRLEQRFTGPARANRPIVTGEGWDVQRLGLNQRDMEWVAGLRWSLEGIARVYGVPLPMLEDFSHATLNNMREARRLFWEKTVVPELMFLQGEINEGLLPKLGPAAQGLVVTFDMSVIEGLGESDAERTERQVRLVDAGILTVNEVRRERNLPPVAWGEDRAGSGRDPTRT